MSCATFSRLRTCSLRVRISLFLDLYCVLTRVAVAALELAGKPFGAKGIVSSMRPSRYYTVPRESLELFFANLHDLTNFFVLEFQRVLFVENIYTTIAVCYPSPRKYREDC